MSDIAIIIPVLNRPHRADAVVSSIFATSEVEIELFFVCSPGDHAEYDACAATGEEVILVPWEAGPGDFAKKQNLAYKHTTAPYILLAADDLDFETGWDVNAIALAERTGAGVIGTQDDANPLVKRGKHATHAIVSRRYIDTVGGTWHDGPGVVYHEGYAHQWVDTELCGAAIQRNEWAFCHSSVIRHLHPMYPHRGIGRTPMDDTYRKALGDAHDDQQLFRERQAAAKAPPR
jgi:glycosyltransferase involved in cell wall biosynthesis